MSGEWHDDPGNWHRAFRSTKPDDVGEGAARAKNDSGEGGPSWFAPGTCDNYEIWLYKDEPRGHFVVLVAKASGAMFLTDYQL